MRVGSLFTGYGGLDMAVGGDLAWYAEIEPAACQVLTQHHPDVPNLGDITEVDWSQVEPVDIITGGYPCQPFSHAGSRKGKNDDRHLWPYVRDAIHALRPRYAILENVSGHLTLGFADVLSDLTQIGFNAEWGTYRASDIGAPHRRERIFIVAYPSRGARGTGSGWGNPESERATGSPAHVSHLATDTINNGLQHTSKRVDTRQGSDATTGHSSPATDTNSYGYGEQLHAGGMGSVETGAAGSTQQRERPWRESDSGGTINAADPESTSKGRDIQQRGLSLQSRGSVGAAADPDNGGAVGDVQGLRLRRTPCADLPEVQPINWGKYAQAITRWERLTRPAPDPTYQRAGRPRLNPQFVEWMMGLPEGHVTGHGLSTAKQLKMLGNGVVPQQAAAAISQLMERTA